MPWATTRTSMPVLRWKSGRRYLNRPEFSVDVVDDTTMKVFCAQAAGASASRATNKVLFKPMAALL